MLTTEQKEEIKRVVVVRASLCIGYLKDWMQVTPTKAGVLAVMTDYRTWPLLSDYIDIWNSGGAGQ